MIAIFKLFAVVNSGPPDALSQFFQTLLNGLAFGGIYALVALGLVLIYKASGLVNFANGEMAMIGTFLAFGLLDGLGWPYWWAAAGALGLAAGLGLVIYRLVIAPLDGTSHLTQLLATVGLGTFLTGLAGWVWNFESRPFPDPMSGPPLKLGEIVLRQADLVRLGVVLVIALALFAFFRFTRPGVALRSLADNQTSARLMGVSVSGLTGLAWALTAGLDTLAGMLVAPTTFLDPLMMSDVALKAFAAAVLGGFTSLPGAVVGGLVLGVTDNLVGVYLSQELRGVVAFGIILLVLLVRPNGLFGRAVFANPSPTAYPNRKPARAKPRLTAAVGRMISLVPNKTSQDQPRLATGNWQLATGVCLLVAPIVLALLPGFGFNNYTYSLLNFGLIYALVALGLTILTGYAGQISLGQSGLVAVGAYVGAGLTSRLGWPFWAAAIMAALLTGLTGLGLALPALRLNGPYLAVVTIGFGVAVPQLLKFLDFRTDGIEGLRSASFNWPGFGPDDDLARYYLLALIVGVAYWLVRRLLASHAGRAWQALRDNETAAQALGVGLVRYKMAAFGLSALLAGLAGALYAGQLGRVEAEQFNLLQSVQFVVMLVVGGLVSPEGALVGAILLTLLPELVNRLVAFAQDGLNGLGLAVQLKNPQYILYGLLLLLIVRFWPNGLLGRVRSTVGATLSSITLLDPPPPGRTLSVEGLSVLYGGVVALDNFSLEVRPREIVGLIGPNGAGKTSAFNAISRFVRPKAGRVGWGNERLSRRASALSGQGIARTFQNGGLFDELSVLENLLLGQHTRFGWALWPRTRQKLNQVAYRQAQAALDFVGIGQVAGLEVAGLPYGTRKLVELARAIAGRPSLLLLDEPAAGLTTVETARLTELLRQLRDELGLSILLVEHDMRLVMGLCDRVYVLDAGKLLASGPPAIVRTDPAVVKAYLGKRSEVRGQRSEVSN